jgi:hypothetical protein
MLAISRTSIIDQKLYHFNHPKGFAMRSLPGLTAAILTLVLLGNVSIAQVHFVPTPTGANATVGVPTSANPNISSFPLVSGDEIGVFTPGGLCVGGISWSGTNTSITVYGDNGNPGTGIAAGQTMSFKFWQQSTGNEF